MVERLHRLVIPAYLLLCLLIGGSVQGTWRVMALQLIAVVLIAWAAVARKPEPSTGASRTLLLLVVLTFLLFVVQLVPLPPDLWTSLPGREVMANGYWSLGYELPWLPVSMAPYDTLETSLTLLPPLAVLLGILRLRAYEESWLAGALLAGTLLAVLLGAIQSLGGMRPDAWWYLYEHTNTGAVGFFANRNHMGTLLLVSIPFAVALIAAGNTRSSGRGKVPGLLATGAAGILLALVGLVLNRSTAVIALTLPVIGFSLLVFPSDWRRQRLIFSASAVLSIIAVALFASSSIQSEISGADTASLETRRWIWALTWSAIAGSFPVGTGFGTFEQVFRIYEDPGAVDSTYVNHAHNDYLELLMEGGGVGVLVLAAFLFWWLIQIVRVWRCPLSSHFARAATIASGAILAHSIVDYPLRTAAIAAAFSACIALMAKPWRQVHGGAGGEAGSARHLKIG